MDASFRSSLPLVAAVVLTLALSTGGCTTSSSTSDPAPADTATVQADTAAPPAAVPRSVPRSIAGERSADARLDTVEARRFDQGRMWTFEYPPTEYFQETYGFSPDQAWYERARLGALRIPGCTASFSSPYGLVLTNHHCGRNWAEQVSGSGEDVLEEGFYAPTLDEERQVDGLYADQLVEITDVTDEVSAALDRAETAAERSEARREVFEDIEERLAGETDVTNPHVEVISLYNGARYSAYVFHRYEDVRLVMIPELQLGYFGGDPDNFTYPRFALDMALFRVYQDGEPLQNEHHFAWNTEGSQRDEPVFVVGNPGSTLRLETVAQLEFRRDVQDQAFLRFLETRVEALEAYAEEQPEEAEAVRGQLFSLRNALKLYRGRLEALNDPVIMARRADAEEQFTTALQEDNSLRAQYGGLVDSMAAVQEEKRDYSEAFGAFLLFENASYSSAALRRALRAYQLLRQREQGASEEGLAELRQELANISDQPEDLDRRLLAARLEDFQHYFGGEEEILEEILSGRSPEEAARQILQNTVLQSSASTEEALEAGELSADDPAIEVAEAFFSRYQDFQSAAAGLEAQQEEIARQLGRARYEVYGTEVPPDATFSLRLADGRIQGYEYNGTYAAPYTSYAGLYDHYHSYGSGTAWDLPELWMSPPETFDLSTPLNLVSTNDITGGNSGSPLLNQDLELVGLIFDGNIESLPGDYIYLPGRMRAVSVDVRGMLEALDEMYDADRLVLELERGELVESEAAADARE